jgi:putative acetyltransferase
MGLGPLAVHPVHQRRGVGADLVRAALDACRALGRSVVVVLGEPAYYARFGFRPAAPQGLHFHTHAFDGAFQVVALAPDALAGRSGWVRYHRAFDAV